MLSPETRLNPPSPASPSVLQSPLQSPSVPQSPSGFLAYSRAGGSVWYIFFEASCRSLTLASFASPASGPFFAIVCLYHFLLFLFLFSFLLFSFSLFFLLLFHLFPLIPLSSATSTSNSTSASLHVARLLPIEKHLPPLPFPPGRRFPHRTWLGILCPALSLRQPQDLSSPSLSKCHFAAGHIG